MFAAENHEILLKYQVKAILTVASDVRTIQDKEKFIYKKINVQDIEEANLSKHFQQCFDFIDSQRDQGNAILVHCAAGVSRSASVVIGYLMYKFGWDYNRAFNHTRTIRPKVNPNDGFVKQLQEFEKNLIEKGIIKKNDDQIEQRMLIIQKEEATMINNDEDSKLEENKIMETI